MSDTTDPNGNPTGSGVRSGHNPRAAPRVLPGSGQCSPSVLPTPPLVTEYLSPEQLHKVNLVELAYAREVTKAQLDAYEKLYEIFSVCSTGVRSGPNP